MTDTSWHEFTLGEICGFQAGSAFPQRYQGNASGEFPFIKVSDMNIAANEFQIIDANNWVDETLRAELKAKILPKGASVFAKIGEALKHNRVRRLSRDTIVDNNMMGAIPILENVTPSFLYFLLSQVGLPRLSTGTSVPYLTLNVLREVPVLIPPLPTQRRIAGILSAYEDLIENNTRRIAILEEMARRLYEEWFVHFRFPGHENVKMVESELGLLPQTWSTKRLEELTSVITDGAHKSPPSADTGFPMASVKDMHDWGIEIEKCRRIGPSDYEDLVRNNCKPIEGDILIAKDGSYLKHSFLVEEDEDLVLLSSIAILRPNGVLHPEILAIALRNERTKSRMQGYVSGVAIPRIILRDFRRFLMLVPSKDIQIQWVQLAQPMLTLCRRLIARNTNLRAQRDLLLPKLISGEIDVSVAEKELEEAAA